LNLKIKIGALAAVLATFVAVGLASNPGSVTAVPAGAPTVSPSTVTLGGTTTVTVNYVDDTGTLASTAVITATEGTGAEGSFLSCAVSVNIDAQTATIANEATASTDTCTVTSDADSIAEATTVVASYVCQLAGSIGFTLAEGGVTTASTSLTCGANNVIPTNISTGIAIGGSNGGTNTQNVEIVPASGSSNDARIDVRVLSGSAGVNGAHVTFLVDGGFVTVGNGSGPIPVGTIDGTAFASTNHGVAEPGLEGPTFSPTTSLGTGNSGDTCDIGTSQSGQASAIPVLTGTTTSTSGTVSVPTSVAAPNSGTPKQGDGYTGGAAVSTTGGASTAAGLISACFFASHGSFDSSLWAKPGKVTVTIIADVPTTTALVSTLTITVVGPPATITVAASPSSLRCGEKATITATVKDAIGQNVSDHTLIEMVTNLGGVLGGTGAVLSGASFTAPISNTIAETFGGVGTAFLLTSDSHAGPYEVVVTAGGSVLGETGVFSTAPISAQVTVSCTIGAPATAAPAATVRAPSTGTGTITAPSTGDAGLADSSGSSALLFAIGGAVAFALAGVAGLRFARR
jgi:hypothetical protein